MDIKQEIEPLRAKLAELETKINEPLDCYFGEGYAIASKGDIFHWQSVVDTDYNQIRNKEVAEQAAPFVQIQRALMNFKCEHDPVFDWEKHKYHYTISYYSYKKEKEHEITEWENCHIVDSIWFSTKKLAQAALDMLKRRGLV